MSLKISIPSESEIAAAAEQRLFHEDRNCLSWWFPKLLRAGLPVPKTRIVTIPTRGIQKAFFTVFEDKGLGLDAHTWLAVLVLAAEEIGFPCFLRTGHTSDKHDWSKTCYLADEKRLSSHVIRLIEFSECADYIGLPWNVWAVRELLPTRPVSTVYRGMPLCREFRCFVDDGEVLCHHFYWPKDVVRDGYRGRELPADFDAMYARLSAAPTVKEGAEIAELAKAAGKAVGGAWSVDVLETERGWFVTDMALADRSWHWPGCPANPRSKA